MISMFLVSFVAVGYCYVLYPIAIDLVGRWLGRTPPPPPEPAPEAWPRVSLLLAAHNEAAVLADRLDNALAMDYPADRYEVVVGSDGSTDATAAIARQYAHRGVRLVDFPARRGKAAVLDDTIPTLDGSIVLLSDANTMIDPDAARKLVRWLARSEVAAVCGRLVLTDPATGRNVDGLYWRYETFIKRAEARLGALLGANGAIYAIRKEQYVPIPYGTIIDDFVIPLRSLIRFGGEIRYEADAVAREETAADLAGEFRRRCRIGAGGFQALGLLWPLLDPRRGWIALAFFSHKILRWFGPFFLIAMLVSNLALLGEPLWRGVFALQLAFYGLSCVAPRGSSPYLRPLRVATMFTSMNAALLVGFCDWVTGRRGGTWTPTARSVVAAETTP